MIDPLQPPINSRVAKKPEIWGVGGGGMEERQRVCQTLTLHVSEPAGT